MKYLPLMGLLIFNGIAFAQGPPIHTETAFVVGLEGAAMRTFVQTMVKSQLLREGSKVADALDRRVRVVSVPMVIPYEVIPNQLVAGLGLPYLDKELTWRPDGRKERLSDQGLGDLSLFVKYQILQRDAPHKTTRVTVKGMIKLPTGAHQEQDTEGNLLPRSLQLGTGTVDYATGLIFTHSTGRLGINADMLVRRNGTSDGYDYGDGLEYDLALGYRVYPSVYEIYPSPYATLYLEANGRLTAKGKAAGRTVGDSGGHVLFISPGVQYVPFGPLILEASFQWPLIQELNGTQLGTDFVFRTGIRWLIL